MNKMESEKIEVLLIEDNPGDARLIQEMLAEPGEAWFQFEYADRLSRGLEHLENGGVDVVLLDLSLPDGQGLDALEKVQAQAPAVPVVVLTGFDDETLAVEALRHGAQDYLVKGDVDSKVLYRAVRYSVERKRAVEDAKTLYQAGGGSLRCCPGCEPFPEYGRSAEQCPG